MPAAGQESPQCAGLDPQQRPQQPDRSRFAQRRHAGEAMRLAAAQNPHRQRFHLIRRHGGPAADAGCLPPHRPCAKRSYRAIRARSASAGPAPARPAAEYAPECPARPGVRASPRASSPDSLRNPWSTISATTQSDARTPPSPGPEPPAPCCRRRRRRRQPAPGWPQTDPAGPLPPQTRKSSAPSGHSVTGSPLSAPLPPFRR